MSEKQRSWKDDLKKKVKASVVDSSNIASAINVGAKGKRTSVSSRQRVVHRDGVTTRITETSRNESNE